MVALTCPLAGAAPPPVLLVLGDSLSAAYGMATGEGWVRLLEQRLGEHAACRVVNASVSGETSRGGLGRLPALLERHRPSLVVIELGGNDGLRGLPLAELRANLAAMIAQVKASGARVVLVGMRLPPNYGPIYTREFQRIYHDLAAQEEVALVPFLLEGVATETGMMQGDGIHAAAAAQPRLLDNVWPALEPLLGGCRP